MTDKQEGVASPQAASAGVGETVCELSDLTIDDVDFIAGCIGIASIVKGIQNAEYVLGILSLLGRRRDTLSENGTSAKAVGQATKKESEQ